MTKTHQPNPRTNRWKAYHPRGAFSIPPLLLLGLSFGSSPATLPGQNLPQDKKNIPGLPSSNFKPINPFEKPFRFFVPKFSKTTLPGSLAQKPEAMGGLRVLQEAEHLLKIWLADKSRGFDEEGRPWSDLPDFEKLLKKFRPELTRQAGYLLTVVENFAASHDRRAAHFAALFLPSPQETLHLLSYAPYEPDFGIRREALRRMIPFLDHQLSPPKKNEERPDYVFDPIPFLDLLRASWVPDRILALKILAIYARHRPRDAAVGLKRVRPWIQKSLEDKSPYLKKAAIDLIRVLEADPGAKSPKTPREGMERLNKAIDKWLPRVVLHGGFCEIFSPQSPELKALARKGIDWIESGKVGFLDKVKLVGSPFRKIARGLRLRKVPEELRVFGLKEGDCITAINGYPIRDSKALGKSLRESLKRLPASVTVEWVGKRGRENARRYVIHKIDPTWNRFRFKWRPELKTYYERLRLQGKGK